MALNTFVYIRDVDNLSDARYCAGMGVDMIGFQLDTSQSNALSVETFKEISNWISGVKIVGEFGSTPIDQIEKFIESTELDFLLVPHTEMLDSFAQLQKPMILQLDLNSDMEEQLSAIKFSPHSIEYLLIVSNRETLNPQDHSLIADLTTEYPVLLGFGINNDNASGVVDELQLEGISLAGSSEIRPGFKDYDELADILETLEVE